MPRRMDLGGFTFSLSKTAPERRRVCSFFLQESSLHGKRRELLISHILFEKPVFI